MAPPPPPPSIRPQGPDALPGMGGLDAWDPEPMAALDPRRNGRQRGSPERPAATLLWLPLGLSSMLLVLFLVLVNRQHHQAGRIGELQSRVEALERSRALERTAVLEQQLRSMLNRLQALEKRTQREQELGRQVQTLEEELQELRSIRSPISAPPGPLDPADTAPRSQPQTEPTPASER